MGTIKQAFSGIQRWQIWTLVIVASIAAIGTYGSYQYLNRVPGQETEGELQLVPVQRGDLINDVSINGSLVYSNREMLRFGQRGSVSEVLIEEGQLVNSDDTLASLDQETIANLEKDVAQARVDVRSAEDALDDAMNPYTALEIEKAHLSTINARIALFDSEDALAEALNPHTALEITKARLNVINARTDVQEAEDNLANTIKPTDELISQAQLTAVKAEQALDNAVQFRNTIKTPQTHDLAKAEAAVATAKVNLKNADTALEELLEPASASELAKKRLSLTNSQISLANAQESLNELLNPSTLDIAKANDTVSNAQLSVDKATRELAAIVNSSSTGDIAEMRASTESNAINLSNAEADLIVTKQDWDTKVGTAKEGRTSAENAYAAVFIRWLGIDITPSDGKSPSEIFSSLNIDLLNVFDRSTQSDVITRVFEQGTLKDSPATPWNEVVTYTWLAMSFRINVVVDCEPSGAHSTRLCVRDEFTNAWDELQVSNNSVTTVESQAANAIKKAEDAVDTAKTNHRKSQEALDELLASAAAEIQSKKTSLEVAQSSLEEAKNTLASLVDEPDALELQRRQQSVDSAQTAAAEIEQELTEMLSEPDSIDIEASKASVSSAKAALENAEVTLQDLLNPEGTIALKVAEHEVENAQLNLITAKAELTTLLGEADTLNLSAREAEVAVARETLAEAEIILAEYEALGLLDTLNTSAKKAEVTVAREALTEAETIFEEYKTVDPLQIELHQAKLAAEQQSLETAINNLQAASIKAPFDGLIASVGVESGQEVDKNTTVFEIVDPSTVEIQGTVDEIDVLFLQVGAEAVVSLEALGDEPLRGVVSEIGAFGTSQQGVVTYPISVEVTSPNGVTLPEGLSAVAQVIIRQDTNAILIPIQALYGSVTQPSVKVVASGQVIDRAVELGISDDFWTVVTSGLDAGEVIRMEVVGSNTTQFGGFGALRTAVGGSRGGFGGGSRPPSRGGGGSSGSGR